MVVRRGRHPGALGEECYFVDDIQAAVTAAAGDAKLKDKLGILFRPSSASYGTVYRAVPQAAAAHLEAGGTHVVVLAGWPGRTVVALPHYEPCRKCLWQGSGPSRGALEGVRGWSRKRLQNFTVETA